MVELSKSEIQAKYNLIVVIQLTGQRIADISGIVRAKRS